MTAALVIDKASIRFGNFTAVNEVSFAVPRGEVFGLLGPNGAGKTTTLKLCLGLAEPDAGSIELFGFELPRQAREARQRVGVVPQIDSLDPDFTVRENLLVFGRYFGLSDAHVKARIPELLEFANLTGRGDAKIQALSGGMKRRLTLARALVNDPDLVILDEPTTGLHFVDIATLLEVFYRLRDQGNTLVVIEHNLDVIK